jgi:hypothetical protein
MIIVKDTDDNYHYNDDDDKRVYEDRDTEINDKFAATRLLKILEGRVEIDITHGGRILRTYNDENGFWESGDDALKTQITNNDKKQAFNLTTYFFNRYFFHNNQQLHARDNFIQCVLYD